MAMRLTHQMDKCMQEAKAQPYRAGAGTFLINGEPITRNSLAGAKSRLIDKYVYCGTCGSLLDHGQSSLDLTRVPDDVKTCTRCKQVAAVDDGFDDVPLSIQLFQEWRQGRICLQKDPRKAPKPPKPAPATPPLALNLSPNFHEIHPINVWRKPTRGQPSPIQSKPPPRRLPQEGEYSSKGWFRDLDESEVAYKSPSKKYVKWINGFGMQEPWERVLSAGDRLLLTSAASDKRLRRQHTDKVTPKTSVNFEATEWSGFAPHEHQKTHPMPALRTRKMRPSWAGGQDAPQWLERSNNLSRFGV